MGVAEPQRRKGGVEKARLERYKVSIRQDFVFSFELYLLYSIVNTLNNRDFDMYVANILTKVVNEVMVC